MSNRRQPRHLHSVSAPAAPQPELQNGGRWHHIASDHEVTRAMRDKDVTVIECPIIQCTFIVSRKTLTTIRAGAMGGDTFSIDGGWIYPNDLAQRLDERELRAVADVVVARR